MSLWIYSNRYKLVIDFWLRYVLEDSILGDFRPTSGFKREGPHNAYQV